MSVADDASESAGEGLLERSLSGTCRYAISLSADLTVDGSILAAVTGDAVVGDIQ